MVDARRNRFRFLKIFYNIFGQKVWLILALNIFGTLSEALGIVLLLPLLSSLSPSNSSGIEELGFIGSILTGVIEQMQLLIPSANGFTLLVIIIGFFFLIKGLLTFLAYVVVNVLNGRMMFTLRSSILGALSKSEYSFFRKQMTGHYTNILGEQVQRSFLAVKFLCEFAGMASSAIIYLSIALYLNWQFGLLAVVLGLIIILSFRGLNRKVRDMSVLSSKYSTKMQATLIEYIKSFKYFRATGSEDLLTPKVNQSFLDLSSVRIKTGIYDSFTLAIREPLLVVMVLTLIYLQVTYFQSPINSILVSILLFYRALNATVVAQRQWQAALEYFGGLEAANDLLISAENNKESPGFLSTGQKSPNIISKDAKFRYADREGFSLSLQNLNFKEKSTIAIIGPSGSGKSSMLDLITLVEELDGGRIDVNGLDINDLNKAEWRSKIGYVIQDSTIYSNSINWNITLGRDSELSSEERNKKVIKASRLANLHYFVNGLPAKYDYIVSEGGGNISGGQRQRLALARELYKDPDILILDEATSALDAESEAVITESIHSLKSKMMIIIVAHKLATLKLVDHIYVIDKGEVVNNGTYEQLINDQNSYLSRSIKKEM